MNAVKDKKGVTLIELVVVIAIMGIVLTAISGIFIYIPGFFKKANARSALQSEAIALMETLEVNLRPATKVKFGTSTIANETGYIIINTKDITNQYKNLKATFNYTKIDKGVVIQITLTEDTSDTKKYELKRDIFLMNSTLHKDDILIIEAAPADYIYIKKPA